MIKCALCDLNIISEPIKIELFNQIFLLCNECIVITDYNKRQAQRILNLLYKKYYKDI